MAASAVETPFPPQQAPTMSAVVTTAQLLEDACVAPCTERWTITQSIAAAEAAQNVKPPKTTAVTTVSRRQVLIPLILSPLGWSAAGMRPVSTEPTVSY